MGQYLNPSARSRLFGTLLRLSHYSGVPRLMDQLRKGRITVLMYHGVPTRDTFDGLANCNGYNIPLREFERHVIHLNRRCHVISLSNMLQANNLSNDRINVVLTFDDGYENNYSNVFRLLSHYQLPATFALSTGFINEREPLWNDVVEYAITTSEKSRVSIEWMGDRIDCALNRRGARMQLYTWLMEKCTTGDQLLRTELLQRTLDELGIVDYRNAMFTNEDYRPMTTSQIREMAASGLAEFAAHSVNHYMLTGLGHEQRDLELRDSKKHVEELTRTLCRFLTIPGGRYDSAVIDAAFRAGYERILTSDSGPVAIGARVLNRNVLRREPADHRFVDVVHGPLVEMAASIRQRFT